MTQGLSTHRFLGQIACHVLPDASRLFFIAEAKGRVSSLSSAEHPRRKGIRQRIRLRLTA